MQSAIVEYSRESRPCSQLPRERARVAAKGEGREQSGRAIWPSTYPWGRETPVALDTGFIQSNRAASCILHPGKRVGGLCGFGHWKLAAWWPLALRPTQ
ncbi:hypothetical protein I7I50_08243 [Histoplasma capsulatum G186AR]|uniref:Uncharacterized protein n=1 Tax=Ajellomyces capsulatus TaxID=5037 RepID=A0A8H7YN81_AJECA|nr:hypothetical protein I7I52_05759 [Histoplasma capsulatum]QSS73461.1 hypothetical protein I7I50_08243 [Histoplasma capsulatum G186AR]